MLRKTVVAFALTLSLILQLVPLSVVHAQDPVVEQWVQRYNGPDNGNDNARHIAVDGSGNIYVTGESYGAGTGQDYATIRYNSDGVQQWLQRYNGPGNGDDWASAIAVDSLGNVYVTGRSWGSVTLGDYATIKYNSDGVQQWVARYNGPAGQGNDYDGANAIALDNAGNIYITGSSYGADMAWDGGMAWDYATIKYNSDGVQQWVARYNGPGNGDDMAYAIAVDNAGNVCVTGGSFGSGTGGDCATIKYNSDGVEQWIQRYHGPPTLPDWGQDITVDRSGNVYVTGSSGLPEVSNDYITIKYNNAGIQQWVARYNGPGSSTDLANAITLDSSGNVYITGYSTGSGTNDDYATIKYNSDGVQQWVSRYNGPGNGIDIAEDIVVDNWGSVYVTGLAYSGSGTRNDYTTIKYNSAGVQQWVATCNGSGNYDDVGIAVATDISSNVYTTGYSAGSGTGMDYTTIKYAQQTVNVNTSTGTGTATFSTSAGGVADLTAVAQDAINCPPKADATFPHGLFSFNIVGITTGSTVTVTITYPSAMPVGTQYWKCQEVTPQLSFEAAEYANADYGFSVKYPSYWSEQAAQAPTVFSAAAPAQVPFIMVAVVEGADFAGAVTAALQGSGSNIAIVSQSGVTLADGTPATVAKVSLDISGFACDCYVLGAQSGDKWVVVSVITVSLLAFYDEALFSEIAQTLQFGPREVAWVNCTSLLGDDDGDNVLTSTLTDGGLGDSDGLANGTIVDPGGPGIPQQAPPSVTTNDATNISTSSATLNGDLSNLGTATTVNVSFQYGTSSGSYFSDTAAQAKAATGTFSAALTGLNSGTTYYFRAKANGGAYGTSYGAEKSFTTSTPASTPTPPRASAGWSRPAQLPPPDLKLKYLNINPQQASANQPVTISTNVVNSGGMTGSTNVILKINGQVEDTRMVNVGPYVAHPVKFTVYRSQPGTYTVNIGSQQSSFTIVGSGGQSVTTRDGPIIAIASLAFVLLIGLLLIVVRRRFQCD